MAKRLSGMDAFFLSMEGGAWPQHVLGMMILDPSEVKDFGFETIKAHLESRLDYMPQFRRRIQQVPFQLDKPVWVDDPNFTIDAHMHRAACPSPGGPREFSDIVSHILSRNLERGQPLWQCWFVEGLADGRVAFVTKTHHAMVDGVSGAGLADVLCDISADPKKRPAAVKEEEQPRRGKRELLVQGAATAVTNTPKFAKFLVQSVEGAATTISHLRSEDPPPPPRPLSAPRTIFNGIISPRREFAYTSLPMADVKLVKNHFGATVNDVIMTVVAGAVRSYLVDHDALPKEPIIATVPMSTRREGDTEMGNQVHPMAASLATDVEDPVERLTAIHAGMGSVKRLAEDMTAKPKVGLTEIAPPVLLSLVFKAYQDAGLEQKLPLNSNLIVSNVPGPPVPLYLAGARVEHIFPVGPLNMGMGLNVTVFSYRDSIDVGVQADPALVDGAWNLIDAAAAELEKLVTATKS